MFFLKRAKVIAEKYEPKKTWKTVRGDTGVKYRVPVGDWLSFDLFVEGLQEKLQH